MKHSYESTSEFIKELIEMTQQGSHSFDGMMSKDRVIGYLRAILSSIEPIEAKATAYDTKEVQDAIECDKIEKIIVERYEYDFQYSTLTYTLIIYKDNASNAVLFRADEDTKLEALTKALEWVEGENNK